MECIEQQIEINWPLKALFHYVSDITNHAAWQQGVKHAAWQNENRKNPGARFNCVHNTQSQPLVHEVTEWEPYQKQSVTIVNMHLQPTYCLEFEDHGQKTRLKLTVSFQMDGDREKNAVNEAVDLLRHHDLHKLKYVLENEL